MKNFTPERINFADTLKEEFKVFLDLVVDISCNLKMNAYLVGGVVRDILLKKEIFDLDIVIEGNAIEFVKEISEHLNTKFIKHHSFGTATIYFNNHKIDFATSRKEVYAGFGKLPKVFPSNLKDDLFRRDFTINAIAISLNKSDYGKIIDFYSGLNDLKEGLIRVLHNKSFLEDPTRILRAIRFKERFSFRIEKHTFKLLKEAVRDNVINLVHPHRLRDEIILLLSEKEPYKGIKTLYSLVGFDFIDKKINFNKDNLKLILRISKAVSFYYKNFPNYRKLKNWIIYLIGILINLNNKKIEKFVESFGLRKGERIMIISAKSKLKTIERLKNNIRKHLIYSLLNNFSFEAIIFFYAYYKDKEIKNNIKYFLEKLVNIRLILKGEDLKKENIESNSIYGKILEKLLYKKIDKNLKTKEEELKELKNIIKNFK